MLSTRARARIRGFSAVLTLAGLIVVGLIAWPLLGSASGSSDSGRIVTSDDYYDPWENPRPTAATPGGDTWTGQGQQYIPLTGLTPGEPLLLTYLGEDTPISAVFLAEPGTTGDDTEPAEFSDYSSDPAYLVPTASDMVVWLRTRTADRWTVRIAPAELENRSGTVSGTGSSAFVYTGDATAARVTVRGDFSVRLNLVTAEGVDDEYRSYQDTAETIAWADSDTVVFSLSGYDDSTSWSIEFFEPPAPAPSPSAPAPSPSATTPAPAPTGGADE